MDIIRVYVGEIIEDNDGYQWIITRRKASGCYNYFCLNHYEYTRDYWSTFKFRHSSLKRVGKVRGVELLEGEDWLCHDGRCYPGVLAGGCTDCMFRGLVREKKRYYEPWDTVWVPQAKKKGVIAETTLFYSHQKTGPYYPVDGDRFYALIHEYEDLYFSVRYRIDTLPINTYLRYDELRLIKRKRHFINIKQLEHVCNDLCLFGPYSEIGGKKCFECETGKIWRQTKTMKL